MDADALTRIWDKLQPELLGYLRRLLVRPDLAENAYQDTWLRALDALDRAPETEERFRAWLFRIATNLAIDELRRYSNWRETPLIALREHAQSDPEFMRQSEALIGTPETKAIASEHLAVCFSCVLRAFPENKAASLLLKEVHGFSVAEIAEWLDATPTQVKNWLQETRQKMETRYNSTCALITKAGVCHQCVELDGFFAGGRGDPLHGSTADIDARLNILRDLKEKPLGRWHQLMLNLLDDL